MQFADGSAIREFELSAEIVESLSTSRVDCRTLVSWGGLLEWLIAVRGAMSTASGQLAADCPVRLSRLAWYAQFAPEPGLSLFCREQAGLMLVCAGAEQQLLLSASVAETESPGLSAPPLVPTGTRVSGDAFYAELADRTLEVETNGRVVEHACFATDSAAAVLRDEPTDGELGFILGPRALDAAFHVALAYTQRASRLGSDVRQPLSLALAIERVVVHAASMTSETPRTIVLTDRTAAYEASSGLDVSFLDSCGRELARLEGVAFRDRETAHAQLRGDLTRIFERIVRACLPSTAVDSSAALPALGASSIDLVRIGSHAHEWLGWTPPIADFLAEPSIHGLVDLYLRRDGRPKLPDEPLTTDALSATERQLWFLECLTNAAGAYNEGFAWRIRGALSIDALERALTLVQGRHPSLRSYFPAHDGVPQRRLDWRQCELELFEAPAAARGSAELLTRYVEDQVCRPFDLERAPPFRCALLMHAAGDATLVVSAHHILCDAWSFARVLVPELCAEYTALLEAGDSPPRTSSESKREVERREPDAVYMRDAAEHFRSRLRALPHLLDFPFDHPRLGVQTHRGACSQRPLPAARWTAVKSLARELEQSPFVVCLAAYQILVQRYARTDEFCVGVPVSLRRDAEDARAFGCLINLSVIRARVDPAFDFRALCQTVRAELIETVRFDQFALGDIVRAVAPARSLSHTPIVQVVFGYRELAGATLDLPEVTASPIVVHNRRAKFDLTLSIDDYGAGAELHLEYASDLLEPESAARILDHFESLLDELVRKPKSRIGALLLSDRRERQQIADYEHGPLRAVWPRDLGLALLRHRSDGARVVRTRQRDWSAAELRASASRIAAALRTQNVQAGDFVALCAARSAEWVAAVLAILEVGAAYVPLDPDQPLARIRHGVARCNARVVVTLDAAFVPAPDSDLRVLELREIASSRNPVEPVAGSVPIDRSRDAVYAIMTSGSTGTPRVAAVTHAGFSNLLSFYSELLELTPQDRVLFATSVGFDLSQKNVFAALIAGAELVIDDSEAFDPERLAESIERHAITVLNCTPSLAYALVAARDLRKLRSVRVLVLGGEPIDQQRLSAWTDHPSCSARIVNSYGPTECSDVVTACTVHDMREIGCNLGKPIQNARCRVVDVAGTVAGIGVPGELWLAGTPLGLGYLGDPAATATKFVSDHGTRWYRTGDLVRWSGEGELQYLGRIDTQVKIRGYRIELAEIESALRQQPEVVDAVVISRPDPRDRPTLIGYVVLALAASGGERSALGGTLRGRLAQTLPSYMIPQAVLAIDEVPRTPSGKLDRNALPAASWNTPAANTSSDPDPALRTLEAQISGAFCNVLGIGAIATDANFFEHGGHSLAAIELVAQLEDELGVRLPVASVFERPVVRDYAAFVAEAIERQRDSDGLTANAPGSTLPAG
jgi:amino acid adenylation domain-containing protein